MHWKYEVGSDTLPRQAGPLRRRGPVRRSRIQNLQHACHSGINPLIRQIGTGIDLITNPPNTIPANHLSSIAASLTRLAVTSKAIQLPPPTADLSIGGLRSAIAATCHPMRTIVAVATIKAIVSHQRDVGHRY